MTSISFANQNSKPSFRLTAVEEELMLIIWQHGASTVKEVKDRLPDDRKLAYTSISTVLRILQHKNILTARKNGREHVYEPSYSLEQYCKATLDKTVSSFFSGNVSHLVHYLINHFHLSENERTELIQLIENKKNISRP